MSDKSPKQLHKQAEQKKHQDEVEKHQKEIVQEIVHHPHSGNPTTLAETAEALKEVETETTEPVKETETEAPKEA